MCWQHLCDLLITGPSSTIVAEVGSMLVSTYDMTDLGDVSQILYIEVTLDKEGWYNQPHAARLCHLRTQALRYG